MHTEDAYDILELTLTTPIDERGVLCELLVDFDNMKDNGIDILTAIKFQGYENYFNRLRGSVFYHLVREF